jgi:hypothetical protein
MPEAIHPEDNAPVLHRWNLRPGLTTERIVRVLFFVLGWETGILWRFAAAGAGPNGIVSVAIWSPLFVIASFLLALPVASAVLNLAGKLGLCGAVLIRGGHLYLGKKLTFDIGKDMRLDGRKHTSLVQRRLRLPYRDRHLPTYFSKEAPAEKIFSAVLRFEGNGRNATVYAFSPERKKRAFPPEGVDLRDQPVGIPKNRLFHLSVRDLADLRVKLQEIGGDDIQSVTTISRDAASAREWLDPRSPFRNRLAIIVLTILIVGTAAVFPAIQILSFEPAAGESVAEGAPAPSAEVTVKMKAARRGDPLWRITAIGELGLMGKEAGPALALLKDLAIKDKNPDVREAAARAAAKIEADLDIP